MFVHLCFESPEPSGFRTGIETPNHPGHIAASRNRDQPREKTIAEKSNVQVQSKTSGSNFRARIKRYKKQAESLSLKMWKSLPSGSLLQFAIANGPFTYYRWWFSIAMLDYRRVYFEAFEEMSSRGEWKHWGFWWKLTKFTTVTPEFSITSPKQWARLQKRGGVQIRLSHNPPGNLLLPFSLWQLGGSVLHKGPAMSPLIHIGNGYVASAPNSLRSITRYRLKLKPRMLRTLSFAYAV